MKLFLSEQSRQLIGTTLRYEAQLYEDSALWHHARKVCVDDSHCCAEMEQAYLLLKAIAELESELGLHRTFATVPW